MRGPCHQLPQTAPPVMNFVFLYSTDFVDVGVPLKNGDDVVAFERRKTCGVFATVSVLYLAAGRMGSAAKVAKADTRGT